MAGYDHGWPVNTMVLTATDYNDNLRASKIVGCAYGEDYSADCGTIVPILSLMVTDPKPLKLAFDQFRAWIDATGPDALRAEILFDDVGYFLALGPDVRHALWRTIGIGEAGDHAVVGLTYIKPIDSRHAHLESIADYCGSPVAPVLLGGVHLRRSRGTAG